MSSRIAAFTIFALSVSVGAYQFPWQDPTLPTSARLSNLLSLLTLSEKISLLSAASPAIDRISLPSYNWAHECERGDTSGATGTAFPSGTALGSSFNAALVEAVAHATAIEVRANADTHGGMNTGVSCFGPVINLIRDGRSVLPRVAGREGVGAGRSG